MEIQWALVLFTLLTGMAGWTFFFTGLNEFTQKSTKDGFMPGIVSICLLAAGALASVFHLAHPDRIMGALGHPTSGIFTEFVLVMLLGLAILVYLICVKRKAAGAAKVCAVLGMALGVLISFMVGYSYLMVGRAAWDTILLPLCYLGTAVPMGACLYSVLAFPDGLSGMFDKLCIRVSGVVAALTLLIYGIATNLFSGNGTVYLICALICSAIVPLVCSYATGDKASKSVRWVMVIAVIAGALLFRVMMWVVGTGFYNLLGY